MLQYRRIVTSYGALHWRRAASTLLRNLFLLSYFVWLVLDSYVIKTLLTFTWLSIQPLFYTGYQKHQLNLLLHHFYRYLSKAFGKPQWEL